MPPQRIMAASYIVCMRVSMCVCVCVCVCRSVIGWVCHRGKCVALVTVMVSANSVKLCANCKDIAVSGRPLIRSHTDNMGRLNRCMHTHTHTHTHTHGDKAHRNSMLLLLRLGGCSIDMFGRPAMLLSLPLAKGSAAAEPLSPDSPLPPVQSPVRAT